jgi:hypothetical protein
VSRIAQKTFTGRCGGTGADDPAGKIVFCQQRNSTGVIDVGMGKYDIGEQARIKGDDFIFFGSFFAPARNNPQSRMTRSSSVVKRCIEPVTSRTAP